MNKAEMHENICTELNMIYRAKNNDYGDSFADTRRKYPVAILIRLNDKMSRLEQLLGGTGQKVKDESINDTLMDMANYCLMELVERRLEKPQENHVEKASDTKAPEHITSKSQEKQVMRASDTKAPEENLTEITSKKQVKSVGGGTPEKQVKHTMELKPKTCAYCGKEFMGSGTKKYCSDECAREAHNAQMKQYKIDQGIAVGAGKNPPHKVTKKCTICGREFEGPPASKKCPDCKAKAKQTAVADFPIKACKHKDCTYRNGQGGGETCDYMLMTGLPRECDFETCDKYKPRAGNERKHI